MSESVNTRSLTLQKAHHRILQSQHLVHVLHSQSLQPYQIQCRFLDLEKSVSDKWIQQQEVQQYQPAGPIP
uniref:Uncharacterized protein MANES_05G154700 n=1 Tax=Rhizophora mucronata TaxID=61149 RepID=A0A2P2K635_RHIMU